MNLYELAQPDVVKANPDGYASENEDNTVLKLKDLRKTRLTLAHLNKLRIANDVRKFEHEKKLKSVAKQYSPAPDAAAAGVPPM
jgi:hypothetical protein